jgi:GT2 family glycosyltransferase
VGAGALVRLDGWRKAAGAPGEARREGGLRDCSLVVATYRRPRELSLLLERLLELADPPGEVVVVDGSPDEEAAHSLAAWAAARALPFDLAYVRSPRGLTRQRNVGIDASTGEYVFYLDDDCLPEPGYFTAIRRVFADDAAGRVGAVCGSVINEMNVEPSLRWRVRFLLRLVPRGEPGRYYPTATSVPKGLTVPFTGTRPMDVMPGCSMAFRRTALRQERFSLFFDGYAQGEDMEMSLRIRRRWEIRWCGDAHVVHRHAAGGRPPRYEKGRMEVRNRFFIWQRYSSDAGVADRVRFWSDIAYGIAYDLISYALRPTQTWRLSHLTGCARGVADCLIAPPRYTEPPAASEYELSLAELPGA